jgi:hypothetical protein
MTHWKIRRELRKRPVFPPDPVLSPNDKNKNNKLQVQMIHDYLKKKLAGALILFLAVSAFGQSIPLSCTVDNLTSSLRLLCSTNKNSGPYLTNVFPIQVGFQTSTNQITNFYAGFTNWISAQAVSAQGLASPFSTNVSAAVPTAPKDLGIPVSMVLTNVPLDANIIASRDIASFRKTFLLIRPQDNGLLRITAGQHPDGEQMYLSVANAPKLPPIP